MIETIEGCEVTFKAVERVGDQARYSLEIACEAGGSEHTLNRRNAVALLKQVFEAVWEE
jgi:hypothetical protein